MPYAPGASRDEPPHQEKRPTETGLEPLDAEIDQADQVASAALAIMVRASLLAIARIARQADPGAETVTFCECDTPGCHHLVVTGSFADDPATEDAIAAYAGNLRRDNDALWGPYVGELPGGRLALRVAEALAIPQADAPITRTRAEIAADAGPGRTSQTRYFPVDLALRRVCERGPEAGGGEQREPTIRQLQSRTDLAADTEALIDWARESGLAPQDVAEVVCGACATQAARVNSGGLASQVGFLAQIIGPHDAGRLLGGLLPGRSDLGVTAQRADARAVASAPATEDPPF